MNNMFDNVIKQLIDQIDEVNYDLPSFIAGFAYGMQIGKTLYNAISEQVSTSNDYISQQILQHYNFEVKNENISSGTV